MKANYLFCLIVSLVVIQACGDAGDPSEYGDPTWDIKNGLHAPDGFRPMAAPEPGEIVYRVNAGGPAIAATDGGPDWAQDSSAGPSQYTNDSLAGSMTWGTNATVDASDPSIPPGVPATVFQTERWDQTAGDEMKWRFPVSAGTYEVRLYFSEIYSGVYFSGGRVFDVYLEGALAFDDVDVYAEVGAEKGIAKSTTVTTDSYLDIEFGHVVENPAVKAIEIVYVSDVAAPPPPDETPKEAYRINSGGLSLDATDGGLAWAADSGGSPSSYCNGVNTGNTTFSTSHAIDMSDPSLPAGAPEALFKTERYDVAASPDLTCNFAVEPGTYEVRIYLAEIYEGTMAPGARLFDVYLEDALVFQSVDVYAEAGGYKALAKIATVSSDSLLTIRFAGLNENPAVKGLEIIPVDGAPPPPEPPSEDGVLLNHLQVKATHNSYHIRPDEYDSPTWEYDMPTLTDQLNLYGVRGFELDLHWDDDLRVYHWPVDPNSTCPYLSDCLSELRAWSDANPDHMPIFVYFDLKHDNDDSVYSHLDDIDRAIDAHWPRERVYTPDDFTAGRGQVQEVMHAYGWPTVNEVRGKIIFMLMVSDAVSKKYANHGAGLQGRRMFISSGNTSLPYVAFAVFDDLSLAKRAVEGGFIVRSRADNEPTMGEISQERFDRTIAAGPHLVVTEYPVPYTLENYDTTIPGGTPARCNPISAPADCVASEIE